MVTKEKIVDIGIDAFECSALNGPAPYYVQATQYETRPGCWNHNKVDVIERETGNVIGSYVRNYSSMYRTFCPFKLRGKWYALYSPNYVATRVMSLPDCTDIGGEGDDTFGFCPVDYFVPGLHYIDVQHYDDCPRNEKDSKEACTCEFKHKADCEFNHYDGPPRKNDHDGELRKQKAGNYDWSVCICGAERKAFNAWQMPYVFPERVHGFIAGCVWGDDGSWKIEYLDLSRADEGIIKREQKFGYISMPNGLFLDKAVDFNVEGPDEDDIWLKIAVEEDYNFKTGAKL